MKLKKDLTDEELKAIYQYAIDLFSDILKLHDIFMYSTESKNLYLNQNETNINEQFEIYTKALLNNEILSKYFEILLRENPFDKDIIIKLKDNIDLDTLYVLAKII